MTPVKTHKQPETVHTYTPQLNLAAMPLAEDVLYEAMQAAEHTTAVDSALFQAGMQLIEAGQNQLDREMQRIGYDLALQALGLAPVALNDQAALTAEDHTMPTDETSIDRELIIAALALGLEFDPRAPNLGLDFNNRPAVLTACRALVDSLPKERLHHFSSILDGERPGDTPPPQRRLAVASTRAFIGGQLPATPQLVTDAPGTLAITYRGEDGRAALEEPAPVLEVVHLRSHDAVIVTTAYDIIVMSSEEFHSMV